MSVTSDFYRSRLAEWSPYDTSDSRDLHDISAAYGLDFKTRITPDPLLADLVEDLRKEVDAKSFVVQLKGEYADWTHHYTFLLRRNKADWPLWLLRVTQVGGRDHGKNWGFRSWLEEWGHKRFTPSDVFFLRADVGGK